MTKFNGPKLDLIIMAGHIRMMNWDEVQKQAKYSKLADLLPILLVIGLMTYVALR